MRSERLSLSLPKERRRYFLIVCVLSILCLSQAALAQSGRRQSKNISPSPPVTVEAKTEGEAKPPTAKAAPVASLIIGGDKLATSLYIPINSLGIAIDGCIEKLGKASGLVATSGGDSMNRKDAIEKAKKQEKAYVVWLELKIESYGSDSPEFILEYSVLEPLTAKVKNFGHVYLDRAQVRNGRVGVDLPSSTSRRLPLDYLMREGGRSVADRMIDMFQGSARN